MLETETPKIGAASALRALQNALIDIGATSHRCERALTTVLILFLLVSRRILLLRTSVGTGPAGRRRRSRRRIGEAAEGIEHLGNVRDVDQPVREVGLDIRPGL